MKQNLFIIFLIIILPGITPLFAEQSENSNLIFRWAFLLRDDRGTLTVLDHTKPLTPVKTGDTFKILLQPVKNAHIYLFLYDAEEEFYLLFPESFDNTVEDEELYYLPDDKNWYYIKEGKGTEKFYLVVSDTRLMEIEALYKEYAKLVTQPASPDKVYTAKHRVIEQIEYHMKDETVFAGIVECPYPVAGEWRAQLGENEFNAVEVKTERFYAKKIRLTH